LPVTWRRGKEEKLVINSACFWKRYAKEPVQGREEKIEEDPDGSVCLLVVSVWTPSASFRERAPSGMLTARRYVSLLNGGPGSWEDPFSTLPCPHDAEHESPSARPHTRRHTLLPAVEANLPAPHGEEWSAIQIEGSSNGDRVEQGGVEIA
jgi:hypothetical protein